jgi:DNA end-binding protein Ku
MRSVWNGSIAFGSATIPVQAYSATEDHGSGLHQLHATDGGRIRLRRTCEIDGADVPVEELARGVELPDGDVVVLSPDELAALPVAKADTIAVRTFTPLDRIDPMYYHRSYYLAPEPAGTKPYVLLGEALRQTGRVAVVTVALRQRETLAMLRARGNVIVLTTLLWPDEVRAPDFPFLTEDVSVRMGELRSVVADVERLSGDFEPAASDSYPAALRALVAARIESGDVLRPTAGTQETGAAELVDNLRAGADSAAAGRAVADARKSARKAAAAKAAATRAANRATAKRRTGDTVPG